MKIIEFKPRKPGVPPLTPEIQYFDSIVRTLQDLPPATRIEAIAASCDGNDWKELLALAAYCIGDMHFATLPEEQGLDARNRAAGDAIRRAMRDVIKDVCHDMEVESERL